MKRPLAAAALALALLAPRAQSAQVVRLAIQPNVGDTLRLRLDQRVEMEGMVRYGRVDSLRAMSTSLVVISRAVVTGRDGDASVLLATTDSVAMRSSGPDSAAVGLAARRALLGKRVYLRVSPDGTVSPIGGDPLTSAQTALVTPQMPATFPREAVGVGHTWTRTMRVPLAGEGNRGEGSSILQATFRLDSLDAYGERAYLTMSGTLARDAGAAADADGTTLALTGNVRGSITVDRRLGWISFARFVIVTRSIVTPPAGVKARSMRLLTTITQEMRSLR